MHFSLTTVLAFAASASACYGGGQAWGNIRLEAVEFNGGENKYGCKNMGGGVRVNFRMRNGDDGGPRRTLDYATCIHFLKNPITNCNFGGEDNQGAWRPRADPNVGNC
ncbi:Secreted protein [Colletotrichum higginsianum IMI 349063]|uniref:Secreted protein n=2 Tax=Colletotrichum higginsianum TaxID=80884 RepID=A0A1B7Y3I4_COLHI|nr:Secreted protein [Colletotrichum higginsianum IMI 349063]OBR06568.1 Secreted protein [Colletotrichum higginsianum IMI 349063]TIC97820.1 hypothetical protein CH35J_007473 [Colletotrichum higginsianum]